MKTKLFISFLLILVITPAFGILSDRTGLVSRLDIKVGEDTIEVETVANYDIADFKFSEQEKKLTLFVNSGLENNLGEMYLPQNLLSGDFTFFINGTEIFPKVNTNDSISFITFNFTGAGKNTIEIIGTRVFAESTIPEESTVSKVLLPTPKSGCLIATATYGSELSTQVQQLRELRDNSLLQTESGTSFMNSFNQFYYSFSPTISDWERENPVFREAVKITLTPLIASLSILNYVNMDSEVSVLGYGISLISLNVGMYFVGPTVVIHTIRKKIKKS